ncbi:unnamed protein product [Anisakis simplex]|uniref:Dynein light chain n=1 Tax=Anisakis simplex TaxID=6269 RepID=A0A0M3K4G5_ANISI|nr:unnamed protein product [Anisakis simplex]
MSTVTADPAKTSAGYKPKAKVAVRFSDMSKAMSDEAIRIADEAFANHLSEVELAERLKKAFEANHSGVWHCAVGRNFASALTPRRGTFLRFQIGCLTVILYQCETHS